MTVGIDLTDGTRGVTVDGEGNIVSRHDALPTAASTPFGLAVQWPGDELPSAVAASLPPPVAKQATVISVGAATALAETWCGAARAVDDAITFSMGEHVTAGAVVEGRLLRGSGGYAASVAWLALNPVEREDYRRYGGLEAEIAAAGIVRRLVWRIKSGDRSGVVDQVGGDLSRLTAEQVFAAARGGDGVCVSVIRDTAKYVGMAIANLATMLDPEVVVLGGTLASAGDMMLEAIRLECSRRLRPPQAERIRIVLSTLGADAAAIGAARAALSQRP